jgi:hypothetical protein
VVLASGGRIGDAAEPTQQWYTVSTPHFRVHYYRSIRHDLKEVAQRVARSAERAHEVLAPLFRHTPSSPTDIVVTDDTDSANGSARVIPYNTIRVFAAPPESRSYLHDYDDWLYLLVLHEYVHILHIDTIHGLPRLVNAILGKTWAPNQIQPRWFIEGLAVYYESLETAGGRNRASIYDMILRMAVLEDALLDIDQISSPTRHFPRGAVPYLYGGRFIQYLAERFGKDALTKLSHRYGGTALPYSLNRAAAEVFGAGYVELYQQFSEHLRRKYELQKSVIEQRGLTTFRRVTKHGWSVGSPRFNAAGTELVYVARDGRSHDMIRIIDASTGTVRRELYNLGALGVDFTPDGRRIVYGRGVRWRTFHGYHDLFVEALEGGAPRQLTDGLRAREPAVSPDGEQVAFVSCDLGRCNLMRVPLQGGAPVLLVRGATTDQFFTPRWSPDGRQIVFSRHHGGRRDIALYDQQDGRVEPLTRDTALDMDPVFSSDGQRIYFSSDRTGVFNVYCIELASQEIRQVTNVLGGAFAPAPSTTGGQLYYVGFSSKGFDLHAMQLERERFLATLPSVSSRPAPTNVPLPKRPYAVTDYSPWRTVYPRNWSFNVGNDAFGTSVGIELEGRDVIGRHSYNLALNASTSKGYLSYGANYSYDRFWPALRLSTSRNVGQRGGIEIDGEPRRYVEENYGVSGGLSLPVLRMPDHAATISLSYGANFFRDADGNQAFVRPGELSPRLPETGRRAGITLRLSYSNIERYLESISAEKGRRIGITFRLDNRVFASEFNNTQLTWSWSEFLPLPWFDDHVLALRYAGGVAQGDFDRRGFFFIGGFPEQDIVSSLVDQTSLGGAFLRGYDPGSLFGGPVSSAQLRIPHAPSFRSSAVLQPFRSTSTTFTSQPSATSGMRSSASSTPRT